jgi:hypothetical protein
MTLLIRDVSRTYSNGVQALAVDGDRNLVLTHTSGLRDWVPRGNLANGNYDAMTMILRQRGLNFAPGVPSKARRLRRARQADTPASDFQRRRPDMPFRSGAHQYGLDVPRLAWERARKIPCFCSTSLIAV